MFVQVTAKNVGGVFLRHSVDPLGFIMISSHFNLENTYKIVRQFFFCRGTLTSITTRTEPKELKESRTLRSLFDHLVDWLCADVPPRCAVAIH